MARNSVSIASPPETVFELLADPRTYGKWVVGSREIQAADGDWPAPGSGFDHAVGFPPLDINDETVVLGASEPSRLVLKAKARPLPSAHIRIELQPDGNGTRLTMVENFNNGLLNLLAGPVTHLAIRVRNREALRRLKALAEGSTPRPRGALNPRQKARSNS